MIREPKKAAPTRHTNNNNIHSDNNDNAQEVRVLLNIQKSL